MSTADAVAFPVHATVRAWEDDRHRQTWAIQCSRFNISTWRCCGLPVNGPSTTGLLRRLDRWARAYPQGLTVVLPEPSEPFGAGWLSAAISSLQRSMRPLTMFGLARWMDRFEVLAIVPAMPERRLVRDVERP